MPKQRNITPDLEVVERAIDVEHLKNRLTRLTFSESAWYFLAFCEERQFKYLEIENINGRQNISNYVDQIINDMKIPLRWLWRSCKPGAEIPRRYCSEFYGVSWDFYNLAHEYRWFELAYVYASAGVATLQLQDNTVIPIAPFRQDIRYEAYDRLCLDETPRIEDDVGEFLRKVQQTVRVSGDRFRYSLNPRIVNQGLDVLSPVLDRFWLPMSWQLPRYTFGDFSNVFNVLRVMTVIHHFARVAAAERGCIGMGYLDSILLMRKDELSKRLQRYTRLNVNIVNEIVHDATFGKREIRDPDPAIQPLIPLSSDRIAISPALFMGSDIERNFTVLLNRLPKEKEAYSRLSNEREKDLPGRHYQAIATAAFPVLARRIT
uniref:Uncharacterized protein n=1 Tax=Candidatus Kentrum sp. TUN TaxID=2126343 RepID=A0A451AN21_9GAMM|nr:MAG: hypothetical protein BECKTUN1418F_GA0071002_11506 [Candidatus Kentron sp. TUN]VFK67409.1 MAG: hypothetical protein BECKTUN1418E_GA0071001_11456 [Candidatus Kentron sp. TUN]